MQGLLQLCREEVERKRRGGLESPTLLARLSGVGRGGPPEDGICVFGGWNDGRRGAILEERPLHASWSGGEGRERGLREVETAVTDWFAAIWCVQRPVGGLVGMVLAMIIETLLFIIRTNPHTLKKKRLSPAAPKERIGSDGKDMADVDGLVPEQGTRRSPRALSESKKTQ